MKFPVPGLVARVSAARDRHLERHRSTGLGFAFAERIGYLDAAAWAAATTASSLFLSRDYLRLAELHAPANVTHRYALIFRENFPVAAVAAQIVTVDGSRMMRPRARPEVLAKRHPLERAVKASARRLGGNVRERVLVCGNLLTWGRHGVAFAPGEDPEVLWPAVAEALYRIRRAEKLLGDTSLVVVKDMEPSDRPGVETLRGFSYRPAETDPDMVLELPPAWRTLDDYLARLDAKYRNAFKQVFKKLAEAAVTLEPLADLTPHSSRLHELYLAVQANAALRPVTVPASYLPALATCAGDAFRCTVARRNGEIVGFITTLRDGDTAVGYHIGFDRAIAETGVPLYLGLLQTTVPHALDLGCRRLSLGRTALEPKARIGAKPVPMHFWARHKNPAMNLVLRRFLGLVPHDEPPERNPFKAER
ncbi:MAG TPA: GNAT family N-acetyltransferase [Candidatus Limnocylindria bacterium]|nr:GNAT family N-acetyltransferase [Candidatus Limnocylindria bacterium]